MVPYLFILLFVMSWIILEQKALNRKAFWVPFVSLSLFASLRSDSVGSDSKNYTRDFVTQLDVNYFEFIKESEIGFQVIKYLLLNFTHNYFWLFLISSIIVIYCYLIFIKKYSKDYFLSVFIFITFGLYTFYFNGLRQGLAMAISMLAIPYMVQSKFIKFISIIFLASLFHRTALLFIIFYFIVNLRIKIEYKVLAVFLGSLSLSGLAIQYLASINEKYETYAEVSTKAGGYLTLGFYVLIAIIVYLSLKKFKANDFFYIKVSELYIYGVVFLIPVAMLGANASGPQRLLFYFIGLLVILIPYMFFRINNKLLYGLFLFLAIFYFYVTTSKFAHLTPYSLNQIFRIF